MSETGDMLAATATRLFETRLGEAAVRASRQGQWLASGWAAVEESGLPLALLSEEEGGFGIRISEALDLVRIGGSFASPVPLGETMIANFMLARAGLELAEGPATIALLGAGGSLDPAGGDCRLRGEARHVPWARHCGTILVIAGERLARVASTGVTIHPQAGACGLPRDRLEFDVALEPAAVAPLPRPFTSDHPLAVGALVRALEIAGALQRIVELTVSYASERVQFGRPIAKQQAVQQQLAVLAGQAAAARAAAELAALAFDGDQWLTAVAAAKSRTGEAAGIAAAIAHQVHGAIGFTEEHRLHLFTRAVWDWRDEFGSERHWQAMLGARILAAGNDGFWSFITAAEADGVEV
ncbi:MAG: acyl-CoA dehydrogenase [Sphingomonadales bacterium]|jgi:acyl-CoA dehydrogenase|nr:acyl-CoA dehydrogenase [Sphingomonadales bacterium]